jgi:hypothetical protein
MVIGGRGLIRWEVIGGRGLIRWMVIGGRGLNLIRPLTSITTHLI